MNSYDRKTKTRNRTRSRTNEADFVTEEERRAKEREARRVARIRKQETRSIGATSLSAPAINALGMSGRSVKRPHGRGETARKVEAERAEYISSRPAVYTRERPKQPFIGRVLERVITIVQSRAFIILALLVAAALLLYGPAARYYVAWREEGVLQAQYEVLQDQNKELNHELDRLQSLEGIEDEARKRGYVYPDEEALVVDDVEEQELADPTLVDEAVTKHEASLPWFVSALDSLFGYQSVRG